MINFTKELHYLHKASGSCFLYQIKHGLLINQQLSTQTARNSEKVTLNRRYTEKLILKISYQFMQPIIQNNSFTQTTPRTRLNSTEQTTKLMKLKTFHNMLHILSNVP